MKTETWASLAVLTCGAMWGLFWLPIRWLEGQSVGAGWIAVTLSAVSTLCALPLLMRKGAIEGFSKQWLPGLLMGGGFALYTVSLVLTDVVHAILLFYLLPVWATLGAWAFQGKQLNAQRGIAIVCGLAGMACILGFERGFPYPSNLGDVLALISGISWAAGSMLSHTRPTRSIALPAFTFSVGGFLISLLIVLLSAQFNHALAETGNVIANLPWIALIALIAFVPPNFLVLWATQRIDPGRIGILLMAEVLVGAISAAALSGDPFGALDAIGTALIVAAGFIEVLSRQETATA